jgi:hypothetical protein
MTAHVAPQEAMPYTLPLEQLVTSSARVGHNVRHWHRGFTAHSRFMVMVSASKSQTDGLGLQQLAVHVPCDLNNETLIVLCSAALLTGCVHVV